MVTVQVPVPEQRPPDQPANVEPDAATAVNVTLVPARYPKEQFVPQSIPTGTLVTLPVPVPDRVNDSVSRGAPVPRTAWPVVSTATH
jgi:hypothetical protein